MKTQALLPVLILLLVLAAPTLRHDSGCGATYCVSIREEVSAGAGSSIAEPQAVAISIAQAITIVAVVSQLMLVLEGLGRVVPLSLLRALEHVVRLESSLSLCHASGGGSFWLPIESICSGRITSKMLRAPNLFGPGRR